MTTNFDNLWDYSNPGVTETKFRGQLSTQPNKDHLLQLQTQIARTLGLQRKFEDAHQILNEVECQLNAETPVARIRYLLERGRVYNSAQFPEIANPLFRQAFEFASEQKQDHYAVDAAHMLAIVDKDFTKQNYWHTKAVRIAETSSDEKTRNWLGSLYNNMGWAYHDNGKLDESMAMFKKALAFREMQGNPTNIHIAKWSIARVFRSMKDYKSALKMQVLLEASGANDAYVYEEIAELYLVMGNEEKSKMYFALAFTELSKDPWFVSSHPARLERMKTLSGK
jgi:tetratricopeptide (TPR) repeat protein